mgnify:CR=1 FL=1
MISLSSNRKRCNGNVDDKESVREERGLAMSKKILILEGSPRKNGNTDLMAQEFAVGATEAGHKVEKSISKINNQRLSWLWCLSEKWRKLRTER